MQHKQRTQMLRSWNVFLNLLVRNHLLNSEWWFPSVVSGQTQTMMTDCERWWELQEHLNGPNKFTKVLKVCCFLITLFWMFNLASIMYQRTSQWSSWIFSVEPRLQMTCLLCKWAIILPKLTAVPLFTPTLQRPKQPTRAELCCWQSSEAISVGSISVGSISVGVVVILFSREKLC